MQFHPDTWDDYGSRFADAAYKATREEQIIVADEMLDIHGLSARQQWPNCYQHLDDPR